jgi:hypothetical protein
MCPSNTTLTSSSLKERIVLSPSSIGNHQNIPAAPFVKRTSKMMMVMIPETNNNNNNINININSRNDVSVARKLRRMKRRLLLEHATTHASMRERNSI